MSAAFEAIHHENFLAEPGRRRLRALTRLQVLDEIKVYCKANKGTIAYKWNFDHHAVMSYSRLQREITTCRAKCTSDILVQDNC
jgi:hypothetical protein